MPTDLPEPVVPATSTCGIFDRSATTGADLPFGLSFTVRYAETDALRFQNTGLALRETHTVSREWPVATLRFSRTFRGGPLSLVTVAAQVRDVDELEARQVGLPVVARHVDRVGGDVAVPARAGSSSVRGGASNRGAVRAGVAGTTGAGCARCAEGSSGHGGASS